MKISFKDKIALVTGGCAGIGKAIVEAYGSLGATVVVADIDKKKCDVLENELTKEGIDNLIVPTDVRKADEVEALKKKIDEKFGRLDIVVNNVGHHLLIHGKLVDSTEEDWQRIYDINLRHMFVVCRAMIPLMQRSGNGGSIINMSSIEGFRSYPGNIIYCAFKHAVTGFSRGLALELAIDKIRVNTIGMETTISEQVPMQQAVPPENWDKACMTLPLMRFGKPEDTAWAAVYLGSDNAGWITGTDMLVDGGGLAGNVWQRVPPDNRWTNTPYITGATNTRGIDVPVY